MLDVSRSFLTDEQIEHGWEVLEDEDVVQLRQRVLLPVASCAVGDKVKSHRHSFSQCQFLFPSRTATRELVQRQIGGTSDSKTI